VSTDVRIERDGPVTTLVIDRPERGNMLRRETAIELAEALRDLRDDPAQRVAILTGAGDRFFCVGGEHEDTDTLDHSAALPVVDLYELIDTVAKPVIAAVNGFAVGGGNVLQAVCDLTIAKESAVFRQVGPMMGSFDAGYGTWYLEDLVGKKKAKEIWFHNPKMSAREALALGLINKVVPDDKLIEETRRFALEIAERGAFALAAVKTAFLARHGGVAGLARMAHDLLLRAYLESEESHELGEAFAAKRTPDPQKFGR
jgi:naphthoate synthase